MLRRQQLAHTPATFSTKPPPSCSGWKWVAVAMAAVAVAAAVKGGWLKK
jgi:anti-sigma-K factor RskA